MPEVRMNGVDHGVLVAPGKDLLQREVPRVLAQPAPVAADDVQALLFHHLHEAVRSRLQLDGRVLLLLQQKHALENTIQLDLEQFVAPVHLPFHALPDLLDFWHSALPGVDHDTVCVAVHHVETHLPCQVGRSLQDVPALGCDELCEGLGIEPRVGEAQAPVHAVGGDLQGLLADVQLLLHGGVLLPFQDFLDLAPLLHQVADDRREHGHVLCRGRQGRQRAVLRALHGREADVVLLDDGGVQRVEIEQQDEVLIQPLLRLQHQAPGVRRAFLLPPFALVFALPRLVGHDELALVELVQQQVLNPLGTPAEKHAAPEEPREVRDLPRQGHRVQVEEQPQGQPRVSLGRPDQADEGRGALEARLDVRNPPIRALAQLRLCQGGERVVDFAEQLPRRDVCVAHEPPSHGRHGPEGDAAVGPARQPGHGGTLEAPDAAPVRDLEALEAVQEHVEVEPGDVVAHEHVRVEAVQFGEEAAQEPALVARLGQHGPVIEPAHG
mmetsp:Transcript_26209/g.73281  ORF Transcript_26209/g.73281 Transcript_26209/m.73281 type:complete len:496 (-) Transcript_26209:579-2066(-)